MSDFSSTDEAFHEDGAQIAQIEPDEPRPHRWMTLDFNRMRRMREAEEQAVAGTGGAPGAPAIEPDPGSPEYRAADAVARRIAGGDVPEAGRADEPGPGHNSEAFNEKLTPEFRDNDPKPPLNPAPLVLPAVEGTERSRIIEGEDIKVPLANEAGDGYRSYGAFKWKYKSAGAGYEWHHIASQHAENIKRFGADTIHNRNNIVRLPKEIHWRVSGKYASKPPFTGGVTIREWLLRKSFEELAAYGREAIKEAIERAKLEGK